MWLYIKKHRQVTFDIIIALLLVVVIVLVDLFIIGLKSAPGEIKDEVISSDNPGSENILDLTQITQSESLEPGEKVFVPILNFHHIDQAPAGIDKITQSYYVEPQEFEQIITNLLEAGYKTVFVSEMVNMLENMEKPPEYVMAMTFDDGNHNFYTNAWPILQKHGIKSSVYIMTGVGGDNYLNDDQIKELADSGLVEIGSHTIYHPKLTKIPKDERLKELEISKDELGELLGQEINIICYPYGLYNQDVKDLAKAVGYKAGLTFDQDAWQDPLDLMELRRISVWPGLNVVKFLEKLK